MFSRNVAGQSKSSAVVTFTTRAGLPPSPSNVRVEGRERSDAALIAWGKMLRYMCVSVFMCMYVLGVMCCVLGFVEFAKRCICQSLPKLS